ncbi:hypothetical protein [Nocardioides marmotae]|uniref:hypothetical protein n=1 Tax=Nocardioides marmotae TaxID=2663857 RepID=UPI0014955777|nr:hypothetical protein [Nocardioides marmotae]QKE03197.1 hypothetical protein HPC71_20635 [Nocardioides marmotae]
MTDQPPHDQPLGSPSASTPDGAGARETDYGYFDRWRTRGWRLAVAVGVPAGFLSGLLADCGGQPDNREEYDEHTCAWVAREAAGQQLGGPGEQPALLRLVDITTLSDWRTSWFEAEADADGRRLVLECGGVGVLDNGQEQRLRVQLHDVSGQDEPYVRIEPAGPRIRSFR